MARKPGAKAQSNNQKPQRDGGRRSGARPPRPAEGARQQGRPSQGGGRSRINAFEGPDVNLLEGRHALEEALDTGAPLELLCVTDAVQADPRDAKLLEAARAQGARISVVTTEQLNAYSSHGAHQGIIAKLKPFKYADLNGLIEAAAGKENALIIATDHVTDAGNFGAICRSAEVVGASGVLIPNKRNARVNTAAYKTSAGAVMHLPIAMETNLVRSLESLKEEGFWVVGASEHAEDIIWDAQLSGRIVLVMGSEGDGLSRLTLDACDMLVKLPQVGKVESLNVAQATTAIAYEWARQCREA